MLRFLFDEQQAVSNQLKPAYEVIDRFGQLIKAQLAEINDGEQEQLKKRRMYEISAKGLRAALDELEQSHYVAQKLHSTISAKTLQEMSSEERISYDRYVYFDKNGFIRVFSLLDKLGTFLNEMLHLQTERVKPHFSYFTVLRHMRHKQVHMVLTNPLNESKEKYKESVKRLRKRRNTEIHYMNSEMQDDYIRSQRLYGDEYELHNLPLENLQQQVMDLQEGLTMATEALQLVFAYGCQLVNKKQL
ncbi:Cthe_2314 family HEPN domain-containing protein [Paenibacillus yanchengensis]|uniref:Cthe_2314 family HEPN domain-containing protein n=1 Tax=Paenibacillus yanchengensis TaxID=2035833 RepID=A0ABW4YPR1_9BACL